MKYKILYVLKVIVKRFSFLYVLLFPIIYQFSEFCTIQNVYDVKLSSLRNKMDLPMFKGAHPTRKCRSIRHKKPIKTVSSRLGKGHYFLSKFNEPVHEISNNVVCVTSKASDQPAHTRSLIRAFAFYDCEATD